MFRPAGLQSQNTSGTEQLLSHLDVFDSTTDQAAGLDWVPGHVKDLQERNVHSEERRDDSGAVTNRLGVGGVHTLSECPLAVARTRPLLQSHTHSVFLASRPTDTSRYRTDRQNNSITD